MIIGSHVSFGGKQLLGSAMEAVSYGANTFMFYTGAPQNTIRKDIDINILNEAKKFMMENGIDINNVICHAPYIVNLANRENGESWNFSISFIKQEIRRITEMGVNYLVLHPGNSLKMDRSVALKNIADALNLIIDEDTKPMILLETMAGKGSEIGGTFEELREIIDRVACRDQIGVCFDTCHTWDAGYDLVDDLDGVLQHFDEVIGLSRLKAVHFNDSKNPCGSHRDRHEKLGQGYLGTEAMKRIALHPALAGLPFILETPNDDEGYMAEIHTVLKWQEKMN